MLARIVENWLTSVGEIGYQAAFAQLLASEGYRVLHNPVHHPFEHGKDVTAIAPEGGLHCFQLKGGDVGLGDLEKIQGQLFALAGTAVSYPGIDPPRPPDRVFLVTNGRLSPPARDRLGSFNDANRARGFPAIEAIERDQLVGRLVAAHGSYLPTELRDLNELLRLVLADGQSRFQIREFAQMLQSVFPASDVALSSLEARRVLASATILTSYTTGPCQKSENHLAVAEGWLILAFAILRMAEVRDLAEEAWLPSFELARDSARRELAALVTEATTAKDLVIPDVVEGLIYPARAALVCGYSAAFYISEREFGDAARMTDAVKALLMREMDYLQTPGEAGVPLLLMIATALEVLGKPTEAAKIVAQWAQALTITNHPESKNAAPDPYHSLEQVLLHSMGSEGSFEDEQFAGEAYTLHVALEWLIRRDVRTIVEKLWPGVTLLHFAEFKPSIAANILASDDPDGEHSSWAPAAPASWAKLREEAKTIKESDLPSRLWQHLYLLPYLPLVYPYRLTADLAKALDYMATGRCDVLLSDS